MSSQLSFSECREEWESLEKEYEQVQETHRLYKEKVEELQKLQRNCSVSINQQKKKLKDISCLLAKRMQGMNSDDASIVHKIQESIKERPGVLLEMEALLPKKNGLCLRLVLGDVNVTFLSKQAKFTYKGAYETFKLRVTVVHLLFAFACFFFLSNRAVDVLFNFLLVWYYCTVSIRESVLINNGSRIKGWWVFHHYISAFLSAVLLTWPDGNLYWVFRKQFLAYSLYQSFVHLLQYYYQSCCLYRLRALGERHCMDLTVEGFQSWMWRGLAFLLPFLFFGHFWQLYNGMSLFRMARLPECTEWQVAVCGSAFFLLFTGNFLTTVTVVYLNSQKNKQVKSKMQ